MRDLFRRLRYLLNYRGLPSGLLGVVFRYGRSMGQPISETKKADLLKRAEARLNFALNLPAADVDREAKIKAAEKAIRSALASKTGNVRKAKRPAR